MKLGLRIAGLLALTGIFAASIAYFRQPPDPTFQGRPASQWTEDLLSSNYLVRNNAKTALAALGTDAVPHLERLLKERITRWERMLAIYSKRFSFDYQLPRDPQLARARGAEMAGLLREKALPLVPQLIAALESTELARESERALIQIGSGAVPRLRRALHASDPNVRARSAELLWQIPPFETATTEALIGALRDRDLRVRVAAALSLGNLPTQSPDIEPALLRTTADSDEDVRAAAAKALGLRQESGPAVVRELERMFLDRAVTVRVEAAKAHWKLRRDSAVVLPILTSLVDSTEGWQAAYTLAELRADAGPAVPALIEALRTEKVPRPFRNPPSAAFALGQIGPAAVPHLCEALLDPNPLLRMNAVMAFTFMGNDGSPAIPELARLLRDKNREVRHATALALAAIGAGREVVLEGLRDCLTAEDVNMRLTAAEHLRRIAPEGNWVANLE